MVYSSVAEKPILILIIQGKHVAHNLSKWIQLWQNGWQQIWQNGWQQLWQNGWQQKTRYNIVWAQKFSSHQMINALVLAKTAWNRSGVTAQLNINCFITADSTELRTYTMEICFVSDSSRYFTWQNRNWFFGSVYETLSAQVSQLLNCYRELFPILDYYAV